MCERLARGRNAEANKNNRKCDICINACLRTYVLWSLNREKKGNKQQIVVINTVQYRFDGSSPVYFTNN